ncbi:MAG: nucleotide exchange factor GrpE [Mycobacterium sp.]
MQGLIGAFDVSQDQAVQAHVAQVLQRSGIEKVVVPSGVLFDPASYEAVSTVITSDRSKAKRVAETIRPGWKGPTGMLRSAQVAVWVAEQRSDADGNGNPK